MKNLPLLNFKWVAGHGKGRENPRVVRLREQSSCPEARTGDPQLETFRPTATRMNAGFPPFRAIQTSAIGTMVRDLLPSKSYFRLLEDRANSTHSKFNRAKNLFYASDLLFVVAFIWHIQKCLKLSEH